MSAVTRAGHLTPERLAELEALHAETTRRTTAVSIVAADHAFDIAAHADMPALIAAARERDRLRETFEKFICCPCQGSAPDDECVTESLPCDGARRVLAGGEW